MNPNLTLVGTQACIAVERTVSMSQHVCLWEEYGERLESDFEPFPKVEDEAKVQMEGYKKEMKEYVHCRDCDVLEMLRSVDPQDLSACVLCVEAGMLFHLYTACEMQEIRTDIQRATGAFYKAALLLIKRIFPDDHEKKLGRKYHVCKWVCQCQSMIQRLIWYYRDYCPDHMSWI